jgi:O-antigen/teichoic acid export membrane protein
MEDKGLQMRTPLDYMRSGGSLFDPILRKVVLATLSGGLGWFLAALAPLVTTPMILDHLGSHRYGLMMMLTSVTALIGLSDFGITNGITTNLSRRSDSTPYRRLLIGNAYLVLLLSSIGLACLLGAVLFFGYFGPIRSSDPTLWPMVAAVLVPTILNIPLGFIQRLLYIDLRGTEASLAPGLAAVLSVIVAYVGISCDLDPYQLVFWFLTSLPFIYAVLTIRYFAQNRDIIPVPRIIHRAVISRILRSGLVFVPLSLLVILCNKFDYMIVAHFYGFENLVPYAIADRVIGIVNAMVTTLSISLWPAFAKQIEKGDRRWVIQSIFKLNLAAIACYTVLLIVFLLFYDQIVEFWLGRPMETSLGVLVFLTLSSMTVALASPYFALANSMGAVKEQILAYAGLLVIGLPTKLLAGTWFGSAGVAAGGFVSWVCIMLPAIVFIAIRRLNRVVP